MNTKSRLQLAQFLALILVALFCFSCTQSQSDASIKSKRDMVLWYNQPGEKWLDGLPIGNGYMGAMVFGRVQNERIALNETSFWSGRPHDYNNPDAAKYFAPIRDLVFAEKYKDAEKMINEHFYGIPANQQAYQPIGDLLLDFNTRGKHSCRIPITLWLFALQPINPKKFRLMHDLQVHIWKK
jgi:hypothetical protein